MHTAPYRFSPRDFYEDFSPSLQTATREPDAIAPIAL